VQGLPTQWSYILGGDEEKKGRIFEQGKSNTLPNGVSEGRPRYLRGPST